MPRMTSSTCTPAWLAAYSASISSGSTSEFIFMVIRPAEPKDDSRAIRSRNRGRRDRGATTSRR